MAWKDKLASLNKPEADTPQQDHTAFVDSLYGGAGQNILDAGYNLPGVFASALQGPTLGWFDEATAGTQWGRDLEQTRQQFKQQSPVAAGLAEFSGGILPAMRAGQAYTGAVNNLKHPMQRLMGHASGLFGGGATYAAGSADEDALTSGLVGGTTALGLGPAGYYGGKMIGSLFEPVADWFAQIKRSPDIQAADLTGKGRVKMDAPVDENFVTRVEGNPSPSIINADNDAASRAQLKALYDNHPPARGQIENVLEARQQGATTRVMEDMESISGLDRDTRKLIDAQLEASKRSMADKGYTELYERTVPINDDLLDMFTGPESKTLEKAYKSAYTTAAEQGDPIKPFAEIFGENGDLSDLSPKAVDYMQRELRRMGEQGKVFKTANMGKEALRQRLLKATEDALPGFSNLRSEYATRIRIEEALEQGKSVYKLGDARDIQDLIDSMSNAERAAFKRGAMGAVEQKVRTARTTSGNIENRLQGSIQDQEIMSIVFGDKTDDVAATLAREGRFHDTYNSVLGNSRTSANQGASRYFFGDEPELGNGITEIVTDKAKKTLHQTFSGSPHPTVLDAMVEQLLKKGYTPEQARQIAKAGNLDEILGNWGLGLGVTTGFGGARVIPPLMPSDQ